MNKLSTSDSCPCGSRDPEIQKGTELPQKGCGRAGLEPRSMSARSFSTLLSNPATQVGLRSPLSELWTDSPRLGKRGHLPVPLTSQRCWGATRRECWQRPLISWEAGTVTCALALSPTTHRTWGDCPFLSFSFLILAMRELMTPKASTALRFWAGPNAWTWMDFGGT